MLSVGISIAAAAEAVPAPFRECAAVPCLVNVVIATGGHGKLNTKRGDHVVALALPHE
jgi:glucose dehydrogenase